MMKQTFFCCIALLTSQASYALTLHNQLLKFADQTGMFNNAIVDILLVRQQIREYKIGKLSFHGIELDLAIQNSNQPLHVIIKRPEAMFGATFVAINPNHPQALSYCTSETQTAVQNFVSAKRSQNLLSRYENSNVQAINTGLLAINPISKELMPIFISDFLESFDARASNVHVGIPAHDTKDFEFAHAHKLPIKLVINATEQYKTAASCPQYDKHTKQLSEAYAGTYDDCIIIQSDFLNGTIHEARKKAIDYLMQQYNAVEYKKPYIYPLGNKHYSLHELQIIEATLAKENKTLSPAQKEALSIIMIQAQADFLTIVEQFLANAKEARELMIAIIDESCDLRNAHDAYLKKWAHLETNESECTIFRRDINSFTGLYKFCLELIDFLEDFAYSCPVALATLQNISHT